MTGALKNVGTAFRLAGEIESYEIIKNGNRRFGEQIEKLLIITGDLRYFANGRYTTVTTKSERCHPRIDVI